MGVVLFLFFIFFFFSFVFYLFLIFFFLSFTLFFSLPLHVYLDEWAPVVDAGHEKIFGT